MLFTLEALEAKKGDALFLHFGSASKPRLVVIDGGPAGVYNKTLSKRLDQVKQSHSPSKPLSIRMVMVSHIDDDHINGVLQFTKKMIELRERHKPLPYEVVTMWHNSFDDIIGNDADELTASLQFAVNAASRGSFPSNMPVRQDTALVLASVRQGRDLRNNVHALGLNVNEGFSGLVMAPVGKSGKRLSLGGGLSFTVLGPREERVKDLQDEWGRQLKKLGVARAAAFADESVFNLSSLIVYAKAGSKSMLLTGDARGDDILSGLKQGKLLKNGACHFDLLKIPHHGSDKNVSTDFFRKVTADHYVVSGNGEHGNPEVGTFKMLSDARGKDEFTIYLTNRKPRALVEFFKQEQARGKRYNVVYRDSRALSVAVDLGNDSVPH